MYGATCTQLGQEEEQQRVMTQYAKSSVSDITDNLHRTLVKVSRSTIQNFMSRNAHDANPSSAVRVSMGPQTFMDGDQD